ncbi:hypothetical protein CFP56_030598 [Quercus suber]|uniref:Uncharacterized protein n=1 Tax=Quercus suber TaxID=58331 RepID=A0AAW0LWQ7_QUESU
MPMGSDVKNCLFGDELYLIELGISISMDGNCCFFRINMLNGVLGEYELENASCKLEDDVLILL